MWFSVISAVLITTVGLLTGYAGARERDAIRERQDAAYEAEVRLALWRMDTVATSLLVRESARSAEQALWLVVEPNNPRANAGAAGTALDAGSVILGRFELNRGGDVAHAGQLPPILVTVGIGGEAADNAKSLVGERAFEWATTYKNQLELDNERADKVIARDDSVQKQDSGYQAKSNFEYAQRQVSVANAIAQLPSEGLTDSDKEATRQVSEQAATVLAAAWIEDELFLLRRVEGAEGEVVQGIWLDAKALASALESQIPDLFPDAEVLPLAASASPAEGAARRLAALPMFVKPGPLANPPAKVAVSVFPYAMVWLGVLVILLGSGGLLSVTLSLSERRAAFVTAVTHELRTPLTTLRTYAEMLGDPRMTDPAKRQRYVGTMQREAERLGHLVENVLSYSQIEQGKGGLTVESIEIGALLHRAQPRLEERASQGGLELVLAAVPGPIWARGEAMAIEQILFNLVDNAAKYARPDDDKTLTISARADGAMISISVADRGHGIATADRKKVFTAFSKSAQEAAETAPGVGLGLALCKRLARQLGGDLVLDDAHAPGTAFVLTLGKTPAPKAA